MEKATASRLESVVDALNDDACGPPYTLARASLRRLWHSEWRAHSPFAPSRPRRRRNPAACRTFIWPKTGSTMALRLAQSARPALVRSRRAIFSLTVASFGTGPLGAGGTCSSCLRRPVAIKTSTPMSVASVTFFSEK